MKRLLAASVAALTMTSCAATQAQPGEKEDPRTSRSTTRNTEDRRHSEHGGPDMGEMLQRVERWESGEMALSGEPVACDEEPRSADVGDDWRDATLDGGFAAVSLVVPPNWRVSSNKALQTEDGAPSAALMVIPSPEAITGEFRDEAMAQLAIAYDEITVAERLDEATCLIGGHLSDGTEAYNLVHLPADGPQVFLSALVFPGASQESSDQLLHVMRSAKFTS
jgi:hypothetical protein